MQDAYDTFCGPKGGMVPAVLWEGTTPLPPVDRQTPVKNYLAATSFAGGNKSNQNKARPIKKTTQFGKTYILKLIYFSGL